VLAELLQLERPLVCLDLETTGTSPQRDRIIQIGVVKILPSGEVQEGCQLVNPGMPIPPESTAVHKITDAMVADAPKFRDLAPKIQSGLSQADICGFNVNFDLAFTREELARCGLQLTHGKVIYGCDIFKRMEPRSLTAAMKFYLNEEFTDAHDALADARATVRVIVAQLLRYTDLPRSVDGLHKLFNETVKDGHVDPHGKLIWRNGVAVINFGKHSGVALHEVPRTYIEWMLSGDFSPPLKAILNNALQGKFPTRN
jgi:DNA polymerase-3 subunit epsilon